LLGDQKYIETVPKRGYRFTIPVKAVPEIPAEEPASVAKHPSAPDGSREFTPVIPEPAQDQRTVNGFNGSSAAAVVAGLLALVGYLALVPSQSDVRARSSVPNVAAELLCLDGRRYLSQRTLRGVHDAIAKFEAARRQDPAYAPAYSGLADALILLGSYAVYAPRDVLPRAKKAAMDALALDENLAEAHTSLAAVLGGYEWNWKAAEREFRRAIELREDYGAAHQWYAELLTANGRHTEAIREAEHAFRVDPHSPTVISVLGLTLYFAGQYDAALAQYRKAQEFNPRHMLTYFFLGYVLEQKHKYKDAIAAFQTGVDLAGGAGSAHLGHAYARAGNRGAAMELVRQLQSQAAERYISPMDIALVYVGLKDNNAAFLWMDRAYEDHSEMLRRLKVDPRYDSLRADTRFSSLLKKINLE
jgi:tetratricopeptide (TPR) repeat protein